MKKSLKRASEMRRACLRSSKRTYREYPRFENIRKFVSRLQHRKPLLVVLFGSVARGDFRADSDADMLIVFKKPVKWATVYACSDGGIHPVVKTFDTMERFIREGEPFYIEMIEDGIPLYDSDGAFKKLSRLVRDAKIAWGLERTSYGWQWKNDQPVWPDRQPTG